MEKIGNVILDDTYYPGEDLYCDGIIEDEILDIVKNEEDYLIAINKILSGLDDKFMQRIIFSQLQIGKPLEGTSKRIVETLKQWS